jgi:acetyl-CoA synthetase
MSFFVGCCCSSHEKILPLPMVFMLHRYKQKYTVPELPMTLLACARIGALHSVVFAGFSADALSQRIAAAHSKVIVTADLGKRGGKNIPIKDIVNAAIAHLPDPHLVQKVLVWERFFDSVNDKKKTMPKSESSGVDDMDDDDMAPIEIPEPTNNTDPFAGATSYEMKPGLDVRMNILVAAQRPYSVPVSRNAEDGLFLLYTSGSTGQPKGLLHTTGGYSLFAAFTMKHSFNLQPNTDRFACVADCGWYVPVWILL